MSEIIWYFSFSHWLISLSIMFYFLHIKCLKFSCTYFKGVKLIFTGGHISLTVAFKGLNVILGLYKCNYSLTVKWEVGAATGWNKMEGQIRPAGLVFVCHLWPISTLTVVELPFVRCLWVEIVHTFMNPNVHPMMSNILERTSTGLFKPNWSLVGKCSCLPSC